VLDPSGPSNYRPGKRRSWRIGVAAAACLALMVGYTGAPPKGPAVPVAAELAVLGEVHVAIEADFTDYEVTDTSAFCDAKCDLIRRGTYRLGGTATAVGGSDATAMVPLSWMTDSEHGSFTGYVRENFGQGPLDPFEFAITSSSTTGGTVQVDLTMDGTTVTGALLTISGVGDQEDWREITHTTVGPTPPLPDQFMTFLSLALPTDPNVYSAQLKTGPWPVTGTSPAHLVLHPDSAQPGIVWTVDLTYTPAAAPSNGAPIAVPTPPDAGPPPGPEAARPVLNLAALIAIPSALAVLLLLALAAAIILQRRAKRRRSRRVTGQPQVLVDPGTPTHRVRTQGPTVAVAVLFDPSKGTYTWLERTSS
jgi:hypothetical protein